MSDIIAIAKMRRSRLCAARAKFDEFIAVGEELLRLAERNGAHDSQLDAELPGSFAGRAPWGAGESQH